DQAKNLGPLESDRNVIARLKNLKWEFHVHDARNAWHEALRERIGGLTVLVVFLLFRGRGWLVRNLAALDYASAGRHAVPRAVVLQIVRRSVADLPDALKIRFAVGCAGHRCGLH